MTLLIGPNNTLNVCQERAMNTALLCATLSLDKRLGLPFAGRTLNAIDSAPCYLQAECVCVGLRGWTFGCVQCSMLNFNASTFAYCHCAQNTLTNASCIHRQPVQLHRRFQSSIDWACVCVCVGASTQSLIKLRPSAISKQRHSNKTNATRRARLIISARK